MKKRYSTTNKNIDKIREKIGVDQFLHIHSLANEKHTANKYSNINKIFLINKEYLHILIDDSDVDLLSKYKEPFSNTIQGITKLIFVKDFHIQRKSEYQKTEISFYSCES